MTARPQRQRFSPRQGQRATFDPHADIGDMWAFVDAALARLRPRYPNYTFTGNIRRYDQVITDIAHP
ncbi:hypothetical protein ABZW44_36390 [Streptomyces mirabilis]|uniref:hypothetical protein n=1 Tax=Streptomyces mirabilis TaxID=68239 RepID=UPI0033B25AD9